MTRFFLSLSLLLATSQSFALDTDGCFQMYLPSVMYPVICVDGSNEEGIGGRGARIAFVGPNSLEVNGCFKTDSIRFTGDRDNTKVTYTFDDGGSIYLEGAINPESRREEGTVKIGSNTFKYVRLLPADAHRVLTAVYDSGKCDQ